MNKSVFQASFIDQKKTIEELLKESRDGGEYYFLLTIASFIATLGLLINNAFVILGGMLIAPILIPILSTAMGVVTSSRLAIARAIKTTLKSMLLVLVVSIITTYLFGNGEIGREITIRSEANYIFFLIAFAAGLAIAYSWVKKELSATLPGIAVAESLLPPLAVVGIGIVMSNNEMIAGSLSLFLSNLMGVILSSIVIFALFGFSYLQREEESGIVEERIEKKIHEQALSEAKEIEDKEANELAKEVKAKIDSQ